MVGPDIALNLLWFVPLAAWFATLNKSKIVRSTITGASLGLVITHASFGLHALHLAWPIFEAFGQLGFYSSYIHVKAGTTVAIILHLVSDHMPITEDQKLLIETVNSISWAVVYGFSGFLWGCFSHRLSKKQMEKK